MTSTPPQFRVPLTEELVAASARFFGLGQVASARDLDEGLNLNAYVESTSGQFVLRVYHQWMTEERIAFLHTVKHALLDRGILVPKPIGWVRSCQLGLSMDRVIELEHYIPHRKVPYSWQFHDRVFPVLGELHDALGNLVGVQSIVPPTYHNYALPSQLLQWLDMTESEIGNLEVGEENEVADALRVCSQTRDMLVEVNHWWLTVGVDLPRQLVHGDFNTGTNTLIGNDQSIVVLDFDFLDFHERVFDVAYSMHFAIGSLEHDKPLLGREWRRISKSVKLYNHACSLPLTEPEWESLPIEIARVPMFWIAEAGFCPNPHKKVLEDRQNIEGAYWIMEHLSDMINPRD